jgi:hypothetical protein
MADVRIGNGGAQGGSAGLGTSLAACGCLTPENGTNIHPICYIATARRENLHYFTFSGKVRQSAGSQGTTPNSPPTHKFWQLLPVKPNAVSFSSQPKPIEAQHRATRSPSVRVFQELFPWQIGVDVRRRIDRLARNRGFLLCGLLLSLSHSQAQENDPGHAIGKVSTRGELIVMELDDGALGKPNLFDLASRTLRFIPEGSRYRVENGPLHWDSDFGAEFSGAEVTLHQFAFPFSGKPWNSFLVGANGSIRFGKIAKDIVPDSYGRLDGGVFLDRFDQLAEAASALIESAPAICVFLKPRMSGSRYVKVLPDRVVITWDLTEPFGSLLDFTWSKTVNRFQAVLYRDGSIEMSYKELAAKDAIVGIYPVLSEEQRRLLGTRGGEVHLSSLTHKDGPFAVVYESFHYLALPRPQDLSCTVIKALGDKFDFLAYYSDFRVDNQEASSPSDGPLGDAVKGIGQTQNDVNPGSRCTEGRFQLGFAQPVYVGSNEMQERPPEGAPVGSVHDITFYSHQLAEASPNGKSLPYNYAVGHLGHEVGHRWGAYVSAKVDGETISLGPWPHWARGLQAPVAFPYSRPSEASTLGGGVWEDNFDETYTQLHDGYFVPATGYSYLDLYLMGMISTAEVPDFFILRNLVPVGKDADGHPIFKADRTKVTIQDVIAAEGRRLPDVDHSQRKFNTGIVVVVEHGKSPSHELIEQANGIREQWIDYWETATGHRASITVNPR